MSTRRSQRRKAASRRKGAATAEFIAAMDPSDQVDIIHDAAIAAAGINFGKLVPVLFLDTTERPDIERLVEAHRHLGEGDVTTMFAISKDLTTKVILFLSFERPLETRIVLDFPLEKWALTIDMMVQTRCLYLQAARPGDVKLEDQKGRLSIDLHIEGFEEQWSKAFRKVTEQRLQRAGLRRTEARDLTTEMLAEGRKLTSFRMPQ